MRSLLSCRHEMYSRLDTHTNVEARIELPLSSWPLAATRYSPPAGGVNAVWLSPLSFVAAVAVKTAVSLKPEVQKTLS